MRLRLTRQRLDLKWHGNIASLEVVVLKSDIKVKSILGQHVLDGGAMERPRVLVVKYL